MSVAKREREKKIAEFLKNYSKSRGGIFNKKTRARIMGIQRKTGRGRKETDFWYDVREYVKSALVDLQLFLEFAGEKNVSMVMVGERLQPLIQKLASAEYPFKPDVRRADIANILIQNGFRYLYYSKMHDITLSHKRTINEALDLANFLVQSYLPLEQRNYVSGNGAFP